MSFSRLPVAPPTRASARGASRCFRTDASGRIPLVRDWRKLFHTLSWLETVAIQSRHAYARLVALGRLPTLNWEADGTRAMDDAGSLRLRCSGWGDAWGRIALCPCCDSPGVVEVCNAHGGEFLQFCALPGSALTDWAHCLAGLTKDPSASEEVPPRVLSGFSLLPEGTRRVAVTGAGLPAFFSAVSGESVRLRVLLPTPELTHLREFTPRCVSTDSPVLTVSDLRVTLQLALPHVRAVSVADDGSAHVSGPDGTLLVSFAPAPDHAATWRTILKSHFPAARFRSSTP